MIFFNKICEYLTSKVASLRRIILTSLACKGATVCFIAMDTFLTLFHCSGNSCENEIYLLKVVQKPNASYSTCQNKLDCLHVVK